MLQLSPFHECLISQLSSCSILIFENYMNFAKLCLLWNPWSLPPLKLSIYTVHLVWLFCVICTCSWEGQSGRSQFMIRVLWTVYWKMLRRSPASFRLQRGLRDFWMLYQRCADVVIAFSGLTGTISVLWIYEVVACVTSMQIHTLQMAQKYTMLEYILLHILQYACVMYVDMM